MTAEELAEEPREREQDYWYEEGEPMAYEIWLTKDGDRKQYQGEVSPRKPEAIRQAEQIMNAPAGPERVELRQRLRYHAPGPDGAKLVLLLASLGEDAGLTD